MRIESDQIRLAATDLSNHLACRHLTSLDLSVARGQRTAPDWRSPDLKVIQELGLRHEAAYLESLRDAGVSFADLRKISEKEAVKETLSCMRRGLDVIAQGSINFGRWFGRPDVLRKVQKQSGLGDWSYEVYDCKLARETKATTILQLALYSALLGEIQGAEPEFMHVVPAGKGFTAEAYRFAEYAAYYRYVKARLEKVCDNGNGEQTYPEPCQHCDVCRWFRECDVRRRADDHLSLVAGIRRQQRTQLEAWDTATMAKLAVLPLPLKEKPLHGSREGMERVREQARVQVKARTQQQPVHELLPVAEVAGFCKLPEPSRLDMFLDLEGDPFAGDGGLQYLFGFATNQQSELPYQRTWCFTAEKEKQAFEWAVDEIMRNWQTAPNMHVYHFGAHEPAKFKWLMGRYATREDEMDRMLRAGLFVDLHTIFKQAVRAGVEEYSLKALEIFHSFARKVPLAESREAMRYIEHWLELGWEGDLPQHLSAAMEGYNEDDCLSTASLRNWLEGRRKKLEDDGAVIPRPPIGDGAPSEELDERQKRVAALVEQLSNGVPLNPVERSNEPEASWMLAQLLDWHRRENKAGWWEGYRLADLDDEELLEERVALAGLRFVERVGVERQLAVDRYAFERQETEVRGGKDLYHRGEKVGCVTAFDPVKRTVDIKKGKKWTEIHPGSVYLWDRPFNADAHADALLRLGDWVRDNGVAARGKNTAALDLLLRKAPRLKRGESTAALPGEEPVETACRIATALDDSVFAIQGPPGAGKTYTGARMICQLLKQGKKVGITALSHKVIRKLLDEVVAAALETDFDGIRCMQRSEEQEATPQIAVASDNVVPLRGLQSGAANVIGGTSWLWARYEYFQAVDVLFIDEAGQMALADVIAVAQAARNLVLIGDPQQLERPLKGSHPPGAEKSALQYLLGERKTIPDTMGLLLPETWRMHPAICNFTSELFYDGRLGTRGFTQHRVLEGHPWLSGAGLWFVPVTHDGNRNSSPEEVEVIASIVESLLRPGVTWFRSATSGRPVELKDILIVAPYNAQVSDLLARLPAGAHVGTVDKFQGQEAPVVIYSLTTSSTEDAPRGMEFLYSLNRLNVATSRAMSNVILVGNPRLFEPECRNPRQIQLANALCRYLEMATTVDLQSISDKPLSL
ncbi:MAG TPA: TM0106 family RecB-like putative nuclease [Candidatus Acidoferrum sp.]